MRKSSVAIIGAGNVGSGLACALHKRDYKIEAIASRSERSAEALACRVNAGWHKDPAAAARKGEVVMITTPDQAIAPVVEDIAEGGGFYSGQLVFHTSGAHSSALLRPAERSGAITGSLHPLQTLADPDTAALRLEGIYFTVEGHERAVRWAEKLVEELDARLLRIAPGDKHLYHAGAAAACNYFVTCVYLGVQMLVEAGIDSREGLKALLPLLKGTVANLEEVGLPKALTGPVARGDLNTIKAHLKALEEKLPEEVGLYKVLGSYTADLARVKGSISSDDFELMKKLFERDGELGHGREGNCLDAGRKER